MYANRSAIDLGSISKLGIGGVKPLITWLIIFLSLNSLVASWRSGPTKPWAEIPWQPTQLILNNLLPDKVSPSIDKVSVIKGSCLKLPIFQNSIRKAIVIKDKNKIRQKPIFWFSFINAFDDGVFTKTSLTWKNCY